jgi:hypothetical protein
MLLIVGFTTVIGVGIAKDRRQVSGLYRALTSTYQVGSLGRAYNYYQIEYGKK